MALTKVQKEGIETLINNNADNRVITGSGTANTLNGESNVIIDANGKLGIGIASPSQELHVKGSGTVAAFEGTGGSSFIGIKDSDDSTQAFIGVDGGKMKFQTSGSSYSDKLVIDTSGNVGIGTGTPNARVEIASNHSQLRLKDTDDSKFSLFSYSSGKLVVRNNDANTTTAQFTLDESGRLGIGTISPNSTTSLHISAPQSGSAGGTGVTLSGWNGSAESRVQIMSYGIGNGTLAIRNTTSNTEVLRINDSGNVGIGTASPASPLHLHESSSGSIEGLKITNTGTGAGLTDGLSIGLQSDEDVFIHNYENTAIHFGTNDTTRLSILAGGGLTFNGDTAAANALDDYEEGTWTPTTANSGGGFANVVSATYTKIGRLVNVSMYANFNSSQPNSNQIRIGGLPFQSIGSVYHFAVGRLQGFAANDIVWQVGGTSDYFTPYYNNSIPTYNQVGGYYLLISASYITS